MHNDVTRIYARDGFRSQWSRRGKIYFKMATVEDECFEVLNCLLAAIQATEDSSSFENSCTGAQRLDNPESQCSGQSFPSISTKQSGGTGSSREDIINSEKRGWIKSLEKLPQFNHEKLVKRLVKDSRTMPDRQAPKAYRNMKKGDGLWKEGYVRNVVVKPNVQATKILFLIKARVSASMKSISYSVYVHLNQVNGDVEYAKCSCKAGQGGCCKHVAALLYTILDFVNLNLKQIPGNPTCTQLPQTWSVPSGSSKSLEKAVKFEELLFEKADVSKPNKRYLVKGKREGYCATPQFAQTVTVDEIKAMASAFNEANRAPLFTEALASNNYEPCQLFDTSSTKKCKQDNMLVSDGIPTLQVQSSVIDGIFKNVAGDYVPPLNYSLEQLKLMEATVGLTVSSAKELCASTMEQSKDTRWYAERSRRVTSSVFGKIINRRKSAHPTSLIKSILNRQKKASVSASVQWGLDNETNAIVKYQNELQNSITVANCGLVVSPKWPWLGCSPDGIVMNQGIPVGCVEVKCPYSIKERSIHEAAMSVKDFYIKQTEDGLKLKVKHTYFYQCQGVLNILNLPWIDFVVYTTVDMYVQRIYKDVTLWENKMLPELTSFYFSFILPLCKTVMGQVAKT